ncbi:MAG TPA: hypothetical protein VLG93_08585 [Sulfuricaulis sp.]|nr:hypothetical protein [Sulfuricaulis sp.]
MNTSGTSVSRRPAMKPRLLFMASILALLGAGPALAADGSHCVRTIDYGKLSASELDMQYRDIDVYHPGSSGATKSGCVATLDYAKFPPDQVELMYRDIQVHSASGAITMKQSLDRIDYEGLSPAELEKLYRE